MFDIVIANVSPANIPTIQYIITWLLHFHFIKHIGPNKHSITQIKDAIHDGLRAVKNAIEDGIQYVYERAICMLPFLCDIQYSIIIIAASCVGLYLRCAIEPN